MKTRFLLVSVVFIAMILCMGSVSADSNTPPRLPCEFYGDVTIGGYAAPVGTVIVAKIGNEGVGYTTVNTPGKYGNDQSLMTQYSFGEGNPVITFFINGIQADQTAPFSEGAAIQLSLTSGMFTPTPVPTPEIPANDSQPTTKVIGKINTTEVAKSVTITPPGEFVWDLALSNPNNNQITIGNVSAVANCNYVLSIQGSTGGYMIGSEGKAMTLPMLQNPVLVYNGIEFLPIERTVNGVRETSLPIYTGASGVASIPVKLQQVLTPADADKTDPTIVFMYIVQTL